LRKGENMGKKIQALKETFPHRLPRISLPKIRISRPKISASEQLFFLGIAWIYGVGILGSVIIGTIFNSVLLWIIFMAFGFFCGFWFFAAAKKAEQYNN